MGRLGVVALAHRSPGNRLVNVDEVADTHQGVTGIIAGDAKLQDPVTQPQATTKTKTRVGKEDEQLKPAAPIVVQGAAVHATEARPLGVAHQATTDQELREVTSQMIQETNTLLIALAFGADDAPARNRLATLYGLFSWRMGA